MSRSTHLTLCSFCYNTLKRSNQAFNSDSDKASKVKENMNNEASVYSGQVEVEKPRQAHPLFCVVFSEMA